MKKMMAGALVLLATTVGCSAGAAETGAKSNPGSSSAGSKAAGSKAQSPKPKARASLQDGQPPQVPYVHSNVPNDGSGVLHDGDLRLELTPKKKRGTYDRHNVLGRVQGGWLVVRPTDPEDDGTPGGEGEWDYGVLDRDGNWVRTLQGKTTGYEPMIDASERRVFFLDRKSRPLIVDVVTGKVIARHTSLPGSIQSAFWAGKRVALGTADDDKETQTYLWDPDTNTSTKPLDLTVLDAASQSGRLLVEDGGCVRVTEPDGRPVTLPGGRKLAPICGTGATMASISPDGKLVVAGSASIEVGTGRRQPLAGTPSEVTWEDSSHVLFVVQQNEVWRCATEDGRCEVALRGRTGGAKHEIRLLTG